VNIVLKDVEGDIVGKRDEDPVEEDFGLDRNLYSEL
jgi:hypothetical protein